MFNKFLSFFLSEIKEELPSGLISILNINVYYCYI